MFFTLLAVTSTVTPPPPPPLERSPGGRLRQTPSLALLDPRPLLHRPPSHSQRHVDDGRDASGRRGSCRRPKALPRRPARLVDVHVGVDHAGHHHQVPGVSHLRTQGSFVLKRKVFSKKFKIKMLKRFVHVLSRSQREQSVSVFETVMQK